MRGDRVSCLWRNKAEGQSIVSFGEKRQPDGLCSISTGEIRWCGGLRIVSIRIRQQDDLNIVSLEKYGSRMTWKSCPLEK